MAPIASRELPGAGGLTRSRHASHDDSHVFPTLYGFAGRPDLMAGEVQLVALPDRGRAQLRRFDAVAHALYRDDPHWVAPLFSEFVAVLGTGNPFFQHAEMQLWVAVRDGRDVGRIAAILDRTHNAVHGERTAHFGFFESVQEPAVSGALFEAAFAWARARSLDRILGPMNPSINDECGLLVDGFGSPPALMMPHNPPFYPGLVEAAGFRKAKDLLAYHIDLARCPAARLERLSAGFRRRNQDLVVRPVTKRSLAADVPKIKRIYNEAWEKNWGAVPLTDGELDLLVARLKPLLTDGLVWLAETPHEVAGFMLALPDANEILQPLRGSFLSPGLFRALPYLAGWKCPRLFRLVALGTRAEFRGRGLEAVMFAETLKRALALGFRGCEASWVLEDNRPVRQLLGWFDGTLHKTYRLYERAL